jgi:LmbE family N-acetylglucosaminyl deacetylase
MPENDATERFALMSILAHPDDESMGVGTTLAEYAAEGVETYVVCATRGERGWTGSPEENPGLEALGRLREGELRAAAKALGLQGVEFLDYIDGDLKEAEPEQAIRRIVPIVRQVRPQVVITFPPDGIYGHPDHIAISQLTAAALICAADPAYLPDVLSPHRVSKLYYMVSSKRLRALFTGFFGGISMEVDGVEREMTAWPDWAITTCLCHDGSWRKARQAILCHQSQLPTLPNLEGLSEEDWRELLQAQNAYYRVYSLVNGVHSVESDLFAGLR